MRLRILSCTVGLAWALSAGVTNADTSFFSKIKAGLGIEAAPTERATIAIMAHSDFVPDRVEPQKGQVIGLPDALADRISERLVTSKRFTLVDRTALRRVVLEQRFGKELQKSYLDRTLDKAIQELEEVQGGGVIVEHQAATKPGRVPLGAGAVGTTGALGDYNDLVKDFVDLGTTVGADYIVLGNLEKLNRSSKQTAVPYSTKGRTIQYNTTDARLRLRIIAVKTGTVVGSASFRDRVSESVFEGKSADSDDFTPFDRLARLAAAKVLDATFPAKVVSTDPLVISRGSSDGIAVDDVFIIERAGDEIKDSTGVTIGRLKEEVGRVVVAELQENIAVVRPLGEGDFAEDDLATLDPENGGEPDPGAGKSPSLTQSQERQDRRTALPKVAIGLIKSGSTARTGADASEHTPIFTDTMITRLAQTKRFQVMDRQEVDQLLTEDFARRIAEGKDMASAMGTLQGVDYLLYGSLASFSVETKTIQLPNSDRVFKRKVGHAEGNMRLVDVRSGKIAASRKISVAEKVDNLAEGSRIVAAVADAYASRAVAMLMDSIFPIKVAAVGQDGTVYVNRGKDGGLSRGQILDIFIPGDPVIDPDTGVQLGFEESSAGRITITAVERARSKGTVTSGGANIARGQLLKRATDSDASPSQAGQGLGSLETAAAQATAAPGVAVGTRARLAVGKFRLYPGALNKESDFDKGDVNRLTNDVVIKLGKTNRFVVLERQEIDQILDEKAFEAFTTGKDIEAYLGQLKGVDYLVLGAINDLFIKIEKKKIPYLDEVRTSLTIDGEGDLRVVDVDTGAILAAEKVRVLKELSPGTRVRAKSEWIGAFTKWAVAKVLEHLYPIKILGLAGDGAVYINRGTDGGLERGRRFNVMRVGEPMRDPDTGLLFGGAETKVAEVEVTSAETYRARAKLIDGQDMQVGDILRVSQEPKEKPGEKVKQPAW